MKWKKIRTALLLVVSTAVLASCGSSSSSSKSSKYTTTGDATSGTYQGVIKNGKYQTSKSRGVNVAQNDNTFNLKSFESGLVNVSKKSLFDQELYFSRRSISKYEYGGKLAGPRVKE